MRQQDALIPEIFDGAAAELQASGSRLLLGSRAPTWDDVGSAKRLTIVPLRFALSDSNDLLSLSLTATVRGGLPRYVVSLEVSGQLPTGALQKIALDYPDVWAAAYLQTGLWIEGHAKTVPLNDISQIVERKSERFVIAGVFLHSDFSGTVKQGLMVMGVLYRSVLDELSDSGRMRTLYTQLMTKQNGVRPRFQRILRP